MRTRTRGLGARSLIELYLLSLLPELDDLLPLADAERLAIEHTDQLLDIVGWESFDAYSTRRQVVRYLEWYNEKTEYRLAPLIGLAEKIFYRFPSEVDDRF